MMKMWVRELICYSVIIDLAQFGPKYRTMPTRDNPV